MKTGAIVCDILADCFWVPRDRPWTNYYLAGSPDMEHAAPYLPNDEAFCFL